MRSSATARRRCSDADLVDDVSRLRRAGRGPRPVTVAEPDSTAFLPTPGGDARVLGYGDPAAAAGVLVLGHGAGGGFSCADVQTVRRALTAEGWAVLMVEQPWLVAGRKVAVRPPLLDVAWLAVLAAMPEVASRPGRPLVVGGRSAGARVACRTGRTTGADAVLCLAFPLHLPGRPEKSRAPELLGAGLPTLVVQGERDPFGNGAEILAAGGAGHPGLEVVPVPGDHSLKQSAAAAADVVKAWSERVRADRRGVIAGEGSPSAE